MTSTAVTDADSARRRSVLGESEQSRYERMYEIRRFEEEVNALFAAGRIHGTTHLCMGQEALAVGLAAELDLTDVVTTTYRGHGVALALGLSPRRALAEIMGKASGCAGGVGGSMHLADLATGLLPTFAIIGAGLPVATGAALAFQTRGQRSVAVTVFGDGASNIGAFHEALNLAAVWRLPCVFVCDNNVYGEYSRIDRTTAVTDIYRRADAYAIPGEAVDGMDVAAVRSAVSTAVVRARRGDGPSFIEAKTYRFAGHSRADEALYRPPGEMDSWRERDPLPRARNALLEQGTSEHDIALIEADVETGLSKIVDDVSKEPDPPLAAMFSNIYSSDKGLAS